jgi:hypothetical protein
LTLGYFEVLERAGVFLAGGTVVGSHAFALYGNMLGVRWSSELTRTQDVDLAAEQHVRIGVSDRDVDLRRAIMDSEMGFIEVPALDRKSPPTQFCDLHYTSWSSRIVELPRFRLRREKTLIRPNNYCSCCCVTDQATFARHGKRP